MIRARDVGARSIINQGDNNLIISLGEHSHTVPLPRTLDEARHAVYGPRVERQESPSVVRWLAADADIVPWHLREDVAELAAWAADGRGPVMRLVTGAGGQGKTVLGMQVVDRLTREMRVAGFVRLPMAMRPRDDVVAQARERERWLARWGEIVAGALVAARHGRGSVLLVVDYAENQVEAVEDLLSALVGAAGGPGRIKALLLARSSHGWWDDVVRHPDHRWLDPSPQPLDPLTAELDDDARRTVWSDAIGAFTEVAEKYGYRLTPGATKPTAPSTAATTLDLYAAALLGVLDARSPSRPSRSQDPLAGVLDHELRVLDRAWAGAGLHATSDQLAQALLAAFLVPAASVDEGAEALGVMPALHSWADAPSDGHPSRAHQAAVRLARLYPSAGDALWSPPTPDRVPDTHVLRLLDGAASPADAAALVLPAAHLAATRDGAPSLLTALARTLTTPRAETNYPRAARRLTEAVTALAQATPEAYLDPIADLELRTLDAALLAALAGSPLQAARRVRKRLTDRGFSVSRAPLTADVCGQVVAFSRQEEQQTSTAQKVLADDLVWWSNQLSDVGRRNAALAPAQEAVDLYRGLARANPDAYLPSLAAAVNNLAASLAGVGRRQEALAPAQEAVDIRRELARVKPDAYLPSLAAAVNNLALSLAGVGRRQEALAPAQEAADLYRELARVNPDAYLPDLAMSVNTLANRLAGVGRWQEALAPAQEAADLYRELARVNPDAYLPDLAGSVNNLAAMLADVGRWQEALAPAQEAVDIRRELARVNPDAYLPDLAMAVNNLAGSLAGVGRRQEALAPAQEAVDIRRELARVNPDAYLPDLAMSVYNLATRLADIGRADEGSAAWDDAERGLLTEAMASFRLLRAGWEWVDTPDYEAAREHLRAKAELLLAGGSEQILLEVFRYLLPEQEQRYLRILEQARAEGVDAAYDHPTP